MFEASPEPVEIVFILLVVLALLYVMSPTALEQRGLRTYNLNCWIRIPDPLHDDTEHNEDLDRI